MSVTIETAPRPAITEAVQQVRFSFHNVHPIRTAPVTASGKRHAELVTRVDGCKTAKAAQRKAERENMPRERARIDH